MNLTHREFLKLSGCALGATALTACGMPTPNPLATTMAEEERRRRVHGESVLKLQQILGINLYSSDEEVAASLEKIACGQRTISPGIFFPFLDNQGELVDYGCGSKGELAASRLKKDKSVSYPANSAITEILAATADKITVRTYGSKDACQRVLGFKELAMTFFRDYVRMLAIGSYPIDIHLVFRDPTSEEMKDFGGVPLTSSDPPTLPVVMNPSLAAISDIHINRKTGIVAKWVLAFHLPTIHLYALQRRLALPDEVWSSFGNESAHVAVAGRAGLRAPCGQVGTEIEQASTLFDYLVTFSKPTRALVVRNLEAHKFVERLAETMASVGVVTDKPSNRLMTVCQSSVKYV